MVKGKLENLEKLIEKAEIRGDAIEKGINKGEYVDPAFRRWVEELNNYISCIKSEVEDLEDLIQEGNYDKGEL